MKNKNPQDYDSPISLGNLQILFKSFFNDLYDAKEFLAEIQNQRPNQSLQWHLAAGIHLLMLMKNRNPNMSISQATQIIIREKAVTKFDQSIIDEESVYENEDYDLQ